MYLKSLELHGFKSFPNRTVLTFERGATVVVGPNGSGKSNISDAMRWVLGEISSKTIRGTKMEDVIFGGTDDKRPMGFAEVSVTFDNTEKNHRIDTPYDEITVTRRYYRSGESEYLINRKPVRLRDIHELFMNTGVGREGYSIIGQGRVAEMISKKSEDRRNIFEEAAGISKYRHKKEETEKKLAETENNMVRVRDILGELELRVGPLEKDAEKAKKYLELYEEKKRADVALWLYDTEAIRTDIVKAEENFKLAENELEIINEALSSLESQSDRVFEQSQKNRLISEQLLSKIHACTQEIHRLDNAYQVAQNETKHRRIMIEQAKKRIAEILYSEETIQSEDVHSMEKIDGLQEQLSNLKDERLELLAEAQSVTEEIRQAETDLSDALTELNRGESAATDLKVRMDVIKSTQTTDSHKGSSLLDEIEKYRGERQKLAEEVERCTAQTKQFQDRITELDTSMQSHTDTSDALQAEKDKLLSQCGEKQVEKRTLEQKAEALQRMEEHFEGYHDSVRFVMRAYQNKEIAGADAVYGPLSQLISTKNEYITAIETALGANMQNIVVDHEDTAKACILALKHAKAGRATFYPIRAMKPSAETEEIRSAEKYQGYIGRADRLTTSEQKFADLISYLLGRTVVFDTIDHASIAAKAMKYRVRIVTLDGQVINAGGSYTGGSVRNSSGVLSRTMDIEACFAQAKRLEEQISALEAEIAQLDRRIYEAKQSAKDCEQQKELLLSLSRAQFSALDAANAKLDANKELTEKLEADYSNITDAGKQFATELNTLQTEWTSATEKVAEIKKYRNQREIERNALMDRREDLHARANEMFIRITEVSKDIEATESSKETRAKRLEELEADRKTQMEQIAEYQTAEVDFDSKQKENRDQFASLETELSHLQEERASVEEEISAFDQRGNELRGKIRDKTTQKEVALRSYTSCDSKLKQLKNEQDRLSVKLWEEHEISYEQAMALDYPPVTKENRSEFASIQNSCRSKLKSLGAVNVSAIEEYKEVKERYDAMKANVDDLTTSYEELTDIVSKIEEEMKNSFVLTFTAINQNFATVFQELFGGGQAELSLTDPENVLTSGIEIKAAPPGKIIKNLSLLSGGEQSFVAIALFFAILKVNPTPFCILDEIEAALDEVNVFRFGEYIKKFSNETQFVLITHRRGTMEIADRLYGVTMPERGISKVLPLDVNEIESKKKELTEDGIL